MVSCVRAPVFFNFFAYFVYILGLFQHITRGHYQDYDCHALYSWGLLVEMVVLTCVYGIYDTVVLLNIHQVRVQVTSPKSSLLKVGLTMNSSNKRFCLGWANYRKSTIGPNPL